MQTFLPYADFKRSAKCLDYKRLGKQRVEAMQIYIMVSGQRTEGGWINHPATNMWRGYPEALGLYLNACIDEWVSRGYSNSIEKIKIDNEKEIKMPPWLGDERVHTSHRSNLLRKDAYYYDQFGWAEGPGLPYFWPV